MRKLKQSVQQAATLSLLVSLVFGSLMPAFSMPVFALEKSSIETTGQLSLVDTNTLDTQPAEKPINIEPAPEPIIHPIDIGQIKPVEILPAEEIVPKDDLLPPEDANRDGEEPEPYIQKDEIKSLTDKLNINTDTNTGAFNYTYPIEIPAGRNNLQPDLALSYNNQDTNNQNLFGYGWSLNIPSIERLNKTGIDNLYTDNYFTSSLGGELAPISLSDDVHGTYGPRVENGDFLKYEYTTSSTWIITDKMGTVYTFGKIQADRQDNPTDNTKIYKWMLSEVRDTNDNFVRYEYYKDAGQIYPDKIFYTGHTQMDGVFEIDFLRETRTDNLSSFQTGFQVTNNYRISQILVKINNQWQKKYYLNYETGDNGNRSLLSGVQQAAPSSDQEVGVAMPETEFDYPNNLEQAWTDIENLDLPDFLSAGGSDASEYGIRFGDVNGDGLEDMVRSHIRMTSHAGDMIMKNVYLNKGDNTWEIDDNYNIPVYFARVNNVGPYIFDAVFVEDGARLVDVNGDGLVDIIEARIEADNSETKHVYINKGDGTGWEEDLNYVIPFAFIKRFTANGSFLDFDVRLVDVNGDGLVDALASYRHYTWYYTDNFVDTKHVYINKGDGTGWEEDLNYIVPVPFMYKNLPVSGAGANGTIDTGVRLSDVNGDALVDIIESRYERIGYYYPSPGWTRYINNVYLNKGDGTGWEETDDYVAPDIFVQLMESGRYFSNEDSFVRLMDINGDYLDDVVKSRYIDYNNEVNIDQGVWINKGDGTGWYSDSDEELPFYFSIFDPHNEGSSSGEFDNGCQFSDVNGDSVIDVICSRSMHSSPNDVHNIYINNNYNKVIGSINNNQGKNIDINYQSSAQYTEPDSQVSMSSERDTEVLLPEEEFEYTANSLTNHFNFTELCDSLSACKKLRYLDINGDSLVDVARVTSNTIGPVYINTGSYWVSGSFANLNIYNSWQSVFEFGDINGDGLVDVVVGTNLDDDQPVYNDFVYINNGSSWALDESINVPLHFASFGSKKLIDLNNDGYADIVYNDSEEVYLNNANNTGWTLSDWNAREMFDRYARRGDVNGDGLIDYYRYNHQSYDICINTGSGFDCDTEWSLLSFFWETGRDRDAWDFFDFNSDGLDDVLYSFSNSSGTYKVAYLNKGNAEWELINHNLPFLFKYQQNHNYIYNNVSFFDLNADGTKDIYLFDYSGNNNVYLHNTLAKSLSSISKDQYFNIHNTYESSAQSRDAGDALANPKLPYIIQTVQQINVFDGVATTTIDYQYSGGEQYFDSEHPRDKKFAGFAKVEKTIANKTTKTFYQQANETNSELGESTDTYAKIGKVYRQEVYDGQDLKSASIQKWQEEDLVNRKLVLKNSDRFIDSVNQESIDPIDSNYNDNDTLILWHMNGMVGSVDKRDNVHSSSYDLNEFGVSEANGFNGVPAGAYHLNGQDQYLQTEGFNIGYNNLTIEGWFKLASFGPGLSPIVNQETESGGTYDNARIQVGVNQEHKLYFITEDNELNIPTYQILSNSDIPLNEWVYFACSRENGVYKIYINGELDASHNYSGNGHLPSSLGDLYIGARYNPYYSPEPQNQYKFHGDLDEVRISLVARSASEILDKYNSRLDLQYYSSEISRAITYDYDLANGNLLSENNLGQVELNINTGEILDILSGDEKTTTYEYAQNTTKHILSAPKEKVITDNQDTKSQELYYDDLAFGQVNKVNLTKEDYVVDNVEINREFNDLGLVVAETDPENNVSEIVYDENDLYPSQTANSLNQITYTDYNLLNGQVATSTAANGAMIVNTYDAFGRLIKTQISSPSSTTELLTKQDIVYQDFEFPRYKETKDYFDVNQYKIQREYYDGLDRVIQTKTQTASSTLWSTQDIAYDSLGRVTHQSLPYFSQNISYSAPDLNQVAKTYTYDALDRVLTEITPVGTTTYEYNGLTTTIYDANNHRKDLTKDAYSNLVEVKEYNGQDVYTTSYEYSLTNKLTKITDALGNIRNFVYDDLDNLVSQDMIHRPNAQNIPNLTYTYDKNGNVLTETNFNNQIITYTYDDLNRVLTESVNASPKITYVYDQGINNLGQLTRVNYLHNGNWQTYNYNFLNQLTDYDVRINNDTYALNYAYNLNNALKQIDYPNSKTANYTFNNIGQVSSVSIATSTIATNLQYNANGQLLHLERGNNLVTNYTYDPTQAYRLTNLSTTNATSTLQNISYTYDAVGNILQINDNANTNLAKTATYFYDDLNRLASTTVSYVNIPNFNYSQSFSYDAIGNILTNSSLGTYSYTNNNPQQLSNVPNQNFVYDNAGNLLTDSQKTLTWDWRSRMSKSQNNGTSDYTSYEYDSQNQRLLKTTKRPTIIKLPLAKATNNLSLTKPPVEIGQDIILTEEHYVDQYFERDDKNNDTKDHVFINGQKIATINNNNAPYYIISDHLNSSSILVDSNTNIAEVSDYMPFGSEAYSNTIIDLDNNYNFTGKEKDEESSLQYFGARYMDNEIGRFVSIEPVILALHDNNKLKSLTGSELQEFLQDPQKLQYYSYSRNNPIILADLDGNWWKELITGKQSWSSFKVELGQAANQLYNDSGAWKAAMDHPVATGVVTGLAGGAAAAGAAAGLTALSTQYLGGIGTACLAFCNKAQDTVKLLNSPIDITVNRLNHVLDEHTVGGGSTFGKSIFNQGEDIVNLIKQGTQQVIEKQAFGNNFQRVFDVGRNIGIDRLTNQQTRIMTVITNAAGRMITAFPGVPVKH